MAMIFNKKPKPGRSNFSDEDRKVLREKLRKPKKQNQEDEKSEENRFSAMKDEQREVIDALEDGFPALSKRLSSMHN